MQRRTRTPATTDDWRRPDDPARPEPPAPAVPPDRPLPASPPAERLLSWVHWFGPMRLVGTALCMVLVGLGGYWLVRTPAPPTEAALPLSSTTPAPDITLPPPTPSAPATAAADGVDAADGVGAAGGRAGEAAEVVVHIAGAVASPGVYVLRAEPRVHDAVLRAGGPTADADLDALNLAAVLSDGQRLFVPRLGDVEPGELVGPTPAGTSTGSGGATTPLDLNRATADELDDLPGVGPTTARAIVDDRDRNGPFARVDDLDRVPGIGPAKLDALRDLVAV